MMQSTAQWGMFSKWHLAQLNIGKMLGEIDSPVMAEFAAGLDPVNKLGDESPGFVWRFQTDDGDATAVRVFDDPLIALNLTVWESVESLKDFAYKNPEHRDFLRRRKEWFSDPEGLPVVTLWWVPAGECPTPEQARERAEHLAAHGPTERAFTFREQFPAPQSADAD